jgi:hypothetical protein
MSSTTSPLRSPRALGCGRVLDNFPTIIGKLAGMVDRVGARNSAHITTQKLRAHHATC